MEQKGQEYHKKVRQGFLDLANDYGNIVVIDGADDIEKVHKQITRILQEMI